MLQYLSLSELKNMKEKSSELIALPVAILNRAGIALISARTGSGKDPFNWHGQYDHYHMTFVTLQDI